MNGSVNPNATIVYTDESGTLTMRTDDPMYLESTP